MTLVTRAAKELRYGSSIFHFFTAIDSVAALDVFTSATRTVKDHVPREPQVPEITPVVAFSVIPGGRLPTFRARRRGDWRAEVCRQG